MKYVTTKLQPLKSFPTYQFHACTISGSLSVDDVFKICILETFRWIRSRLKDFPEIPPEIMTPEPDNYQNFPESDLHSFSFNMGLNVDVIYIEKSGIWSFQISEPDMGANLNSKNARPPVNGRTFSTDIAFLKRKDCVETGIRTICSDPYNCEIPCEVFRPTVVKALAKRPDMSFQQFGFRLDGQPLRITSKGSLAYLDSILNSESCDMPIVLIASTGYEPVEETPKKPEMISAPEISLSSVSRGMSFSSTSAMDFTLDLSKADIKKSSAKINQIVSKKKEKPPKTAPLPNVTAPKAKPQKRDEFPFEKLAEMCLGFAVVCFVDEPFLPHLKNKFRIDLHSGDIAIYSHLQESERYAYEQYRDDMEQFCKTLRKMIHLMPKRCSYSFGDVVFHSDARIAELREKRHESNSEDERFQLLREENSELKKQIQEISQQNANMHLTSELLRTTQKKLKSAEDELDALRIFCERFRQEQDEKETLYQKSAELVAFYKGMADISAEFPTDKDSVCDWTETHFGEHLAVTTKARSELHKYSGSLNTAILCNGIVYLDAYARFRRGEISAEILEMYAQRYHWEVTSCGKEALRVRHEDYLVTFQKKKYLMDLHIRYGIKAKGLIRIYFFWEEQLQKIVIGCMPEHLATVKKNT
ncbi:MAG TPA: hypothetical protein DCO72_04600 [Ruminococcus sp.]|nr:hypothetical protein [Ruminococcus sp.]